MCGITGIVDRTNPISRNLLISMCDQIQHRGPDDHGVYVNSRVGLGHRRLSIIDLSPTGHQPILVENDSVVIVYNGEIYNYLNIKQDLINNGYSFKGTSDTETIINGYLEYGLDIIKKLNGIFSIAILDKRSDRLILARDRFGVKPLYYYLDDNTYIFASEIKSILKAGIKPELNYQSLHEFLYYGYSMEEKTMLKNIKKLLPGHYITVNTKEWKFEIEAFWKHEDLFPEMFSITEQDAVKKTRNLLESAVKRQLLSDVPVGVFLSGGIDSSAITAFASQHYKTKIKTYSAGFDFNSGHNELPLARKIAKKFGTDHNELMIKGAELPTVIEKMVYHHDEPFSDAANIPLFLLTSQIKNHCTVVLQGDGGDEMFGGYSRYHLLQKYNYYKFGLSLLNPFKSMIPLKSLANRVERFYPIFTEKNEGKMLAKLLTMETEENSPLNVLTKEMQAKCAQHNPFQYYEHLANRFKKLKGLPQKMLWIDSLIILPDQFLEKVDKSTMASSVEVRVPFLDNELSSFAMRLPGKLKVKKGIKKYILKKSLEGIIPNEVLYGPKKGFGVPYSNWLKGPLKSYLNDKLNSEYIKGLGLFNTKQINTLIADHNSGKANNGFMLWKILNLSIWLESKSIHL